MLHIGTMFAGMLGQSQNKQSQPRQQNTSKFVSTHHQLATDTTSFSNSKMPGNQPRFGMDGTTHPQNQPDHKFSFLENIDHLVEGEDFDFAALIPKDEVSSCSTPQTTSNKKDKTQTEKEFRARTKHDISYMEEQLKKAGINPESLKPYLPERGPKEKPLTHNEIAAACRERRNQYLQRLKAKFTTLMVRDNSLQMLKGIESKVLKNKLAKEFTTLNRQTPVTFQEAAENATNPLQQEYDEDRL